MSRSVFRAAPLMAALIGGSATCTFLLAIPQTAQAQTASPLAGVNVPRGGAIYDQVQDQFKNLLSSLAKEEAINRIPEDGLELYAWKGANYRADKVAFTKSNLSSTLEAAGYNIHELTRNDTVGVNIFNIFPSEEGLAFEPSVVKDSNYFIAQNNAKKVAFVGAWLESNDTLLLGLLPINFKAPRATAKFGVLPANAVLIKDWKKVAASLPPVKMPTFPAIFVKPGTARGWLRDSNGKPVVGAEVTVESSIAGGVRTHHSARSNAQGLYQVLVPNGISKVIQVETIKTYNGRRYNLWLTPARGEAKQFNAKSGGTENFLLRTTGPEGGVIRMVNNLPDKSYVEIQLLPSGPLLDGTTGKTLLYRFSSSPYDQTYLVGVPLGRYIFSARVDDEGTIIPIRVHRIQGSDAEQAKKPSLVVDFQPGYSYSALAEGGNRNVVQFDISLTP